MPSRCACNAVASSKLFIGHAAKDPLDRVGLAAPKQMHVDSGPMLGDILANLERRENVRP